MTRGTGLTATELLEALAELMPRLTCATIRDVARIADRDDLLLFLQSPEERFALHIVPGGPRSRVCCTERRFSRALFQTGPLIDRLGQTLRGARLTAVQTHPGERLCTFTVQLEQTTWFLHIELFGARGLWCLVDAEDRIQALSRLPNTKGRDLRPGALYTAPARRDSLPEDPPSRFEAPVLAAIDAFFTSRDQDEELQALHRRLSQALERATRRLTHKVEGLARQQTEIGRVDELRSRADLLLAYGFGAAPGAESITVPDPDNPDAQLVLPLAPGKPVQLQAEKLYQRARKLENGQAMAAQRRQQADLELAALEQLRARLGSATEIQQLEDLFTDLVNLGLIRAPKQASRITPSSRSKQLTKITKGHNVRCFTSEVGDLIMVGRTNQQNDRLSLAIARGNDYWLHVGRGYTGSHVVVRILKDKTPSLETLLDAGTLAIHFSKARNAERCEVIYTQAKNVRKPKGLPPGKVTTTNTKTLQIDMEPGRLQRLLDSAIGSE